MTPFLFSQAHFFYFCNTRLFLIFQNYSDIARHNIVLLHSGMALKSIRCTLTNEGDIFKAWREYNVKLLGLETTNLQKD